MYLHEDAVELNQMVEATAMAIGQPAAHVIKDYYVTMMLREVLSNNEQLVFKGGTALSKCYGLIERFSEDIDLGIEEPRATQGQRKKVKRAIQDAAETLGLKIGNLDQTRSRRDFNRYELLLPEDYSGSVVTNVLLVETAMMTPITPTTERTVSSFIGDHLAEIGQEELVERYSLAPFQVKVTSLERSFCDKVHAVCDYYLEKKDLAKPSRHIYDIHKLLGAVTLDAALRDLMDQVGLERRASTLSCSSAQEGVDLAEVLRAAVDEDAYRAGYGNTTMKLLNPGEDVSYEMAIESTNAVIRFLESK